MMITTFSCKHCGAGVDVPDSPGAVTCAYCGSSHRVSFADGTVSVELVAKVKQLDEDVTRLKGGQATPKALPSLKARLEMIDEGKQKWHEYFSSVKAGKDKNSPEMMAAFSEAQADLIRGYGPASGPLIEDAYGAKLLGVDPPAGYSCLFMLLAVIILSAVFGGIFLYEGNAKNGIILLAIGVVGTVAGIPFVIVMIRSDKRDMTKRRTALGRLDEIEAEMRRKLAAGQDG